MALRSIGVLLSLLSGVSATLHTAGGPKPGVLNVHIVPHTHDDVGWLKTVDQYYAGLNSSIQHANVKSVLDSVVRSLASNPDRTFIYVEIAFFYRWWRQQSEATKDLVRGLVKKGQLQFANGGWCMHDEATPHYLDMIDQTTTGHRFLKEELGVSPKIGWQLDPFGHSATQAALLSAEVGFVGLFFGRIDYEDLAIRRSTKACEFVWRASPSLGPNAQVFSSLSGECQGNYGPPQGLNWDIFSDDDVINDDKLLHDYNVKSRVDDFVAAAKDLAKVIQGEHIMFTMGSDFQYSAAENWFENLDKIIHYANLDGRVNAFYSTPETYVAAKAAEKKVSWPLKTDDFFPYADGQHQFWSGYSTSRPALKGFVRETSSFSQMARQVAALSGEQGSMLPLAQALGVLQHHDAVSGTEKQHVAFDYAQRLAAGRALAVPVFKAGLARLSGASISALELCFLRNVSICPATQALTDQSQPTQLLLWNGMAQARTELVELPLGASHARVSGPDGQELPSQVVQSLPSITDYDKPAGGAQKTLLFEAQLPPLGFATITLDPSTASTPVAAAAPVLPPGRAKNNGDDESSAGPPVLENEFLRAEFCPKLGHLHRITDKVKNVTAQVSQGWFYYKASTGNKESGQASGAYIFRPNSSTAEAVASAPAKWSLVRGPVADEIVQVFTTWVSQRVRLAKGARHLEITYTVGPIPIGDGWGKEVVSRFETDIKNAGESYTDSNGRDMIRRKRDFRPSWKYNATDHGEPVAGNFYPVTTAAFIRDERAQLTVLTDRSQSGSGSVSDGRLELMVHRRLLKDDSRGAGEPLNETQFVSPYVGSKGGGARSGPGLVVRGRHLLTLSTPDSAAGSWRPLMDRNFLPPLPVFGAASAATGQSYTALTKALPQNVQLVTLEILADGRLLVRLAHQFAVGEDKELSKPVVVDLSRLFAGRRLVGIEERGLTGTISHREVIQRRVHWPVQGEDAGAEPDEPTDATPTEAARVVLGPLQIRTFYVKVAAPDIIA